MSSAPDVERALADLRRSLDCGRLAHAYLVIGSPRREAGELAEAVIRLLVGSSGGTRAGRGHPDVLWVEPRSKLRTIKVDDIRALNHRMQTTAFAGGWKIGVIANADRMPVEAANAFLKTLEEPPPRSLLLLLSDAPEGILPTIRSRAQTLHVSGAQGLETGDWREPLLDVLRAGPPRNALQALQRAARIDGLIQQEKKRISEELKQGGGDAEAGTGEEEVEDQVLAARIVARTLETQADMMRVLLFWHRDLLFCSLNLDPALLNFPGEEATLRAQAADLTPGKALQTVQMQQEAMLRMQRMGSAIPLEEAFFGWGRMAMRPARQG